PSSSAELGGRRSPRRVLAPLDRERHRTPGRREMPFRGQISLVGRSSYRDMTPRFRRRRCSQSRVQKSWIFQGNRSAPGVSRTPDLQVRSLTLYPAELRARAAERRGIKEVRRPQVTAGRALAWAVPLERAATMAVSQARPSAEVAV